MRQQIRVHTNWTVQHGSLDQFMEIEYVCGSLFAALFRFHCLIHHITKGKTKFKPFVGLLGGNKNIPHKLFVQCIVYGSLFLPIVDELNGLPIVDSVR